MQSTHSHVARIGFACLLSLAAWAHSSEPLDLKLPTDNAIVDAADAAATPPGNPAADPQAAPNPHAWPSAFSYEDANPRNRTAAPACDEATYNQAQVHGSMGVGVVGGNHVSGNYQTGVVHVTKALGSCENPTGTVSVSVGVTKGDFNGSRHWRH